MRLLQIAMFECFNPKREEICVCEVASSPCTTTFASQIEEQDFVHWVAVTSFYSPALANREEEETKMYYTLFNSAIWPRCWYVCMQSFFGAGKEVGRIFAPPWKCLHYCKPIQKSYNIKCMILRRLLVYETENGEDLKIDMNWRKNHCHAVYSIMIWYALISRDPLCNPSQKWPTCEAQKSPRLP